MLTAFPELQVSQRQRSTSPHGPVAGREGLRSVPARLYDFGLDLLALRRLPT
ncbi:hypothetical protein ACWDXV_18125 [Nocardia nova]